MARGIGFRQLGQNANTGGASLGTSATSQLIFPHSLEHQKGSKMYVYNSYAKSAMVISNFAAAETDERH